MSASNETAATQRNFSLSVGWMIVGNGSSPSLQLMVKISRCSSASHQSKCISGTVATSMIYVTIP